MFSKHKKILLTLIALVILFFGYWYFVLSKKPATTQNMNTGGLTAGVIEAETNVSSTTDNSLKVDKEFVNGILALNSVNIDTTIFTTDAYKSLSFPDAPFPVDYAIPVGRVNPFLPIGVNGRSPFTISTQSQENRQNDVPVVVATSTPAPAVPATTTKPAVVPKPTNR